MSTDNNQLPRCPTFPGDDWPLYTRQHPDLMTEEELIEFLRIKEVSKAEDFHNVVENLKQNRDLPRVHICNKALYPKKAVLKWIEENTEK